MLTVQKPVELVLQRLRALGRTIRPSGTWQVTHCPAHEDVQASLGVKEDSRTGRAVVKCFAGCRNEDVLKALGLGVRDLFTPGPEPLDRESVLTVEALARAKGLPSSYLRELGLREYARGVVIPYRGEDGSLGRTRLRLSLQGPHRFRWSTKPDSTGQRPPLMPYGLWRLSEARARGLLCLVEGESDCWAAWRQGVPALGFPGADTAGLLRREHVSGIAQLYVLQEPDACGAAFVGALARRLESFGRLSQARVIRLAAKDLSELHLQVKGQGEAFQLEFQAGVDASTPLEAPAAVEASGSDWPALLALETQEPPPAFGLEASCGYLPPYRDYLAAVAESYQVDPAMPALASLSCVSLSISRAVEVRLGPDWRQPSPVWTCVIAAPGERKSAVFSALAGPILAYDHLRSERLRTPLARYAAYTRHLARRAEQLRAKLAKQEDPQGLKELLDVEVQAALRESPEMPCLHLMDATPECVAVGLARNGERVGILSSEASVLENALGRYSDQPNLDVYLQAHEGDPYRYTRRKGDDVILKRPAVTFGLSVQPFAAKALLEHQASVGRGLMARFQYALVHSRKGSRALSPPPVPGHLSQWWSDRLSDLLALPYPQEPYFEGDCLIRRSCEPRLVTLSAPAAELFESSRAEIERELSPVDGTLAHTFGWAEKLCGTIGRIALALELLSRTDAREIREETMHAALMWSEYLRAAHRHALAFAGLDVVAEQARALVGWIRRFRKTRFTRREARRATRNKQFARDADYAPIFQLLVARHYLREARVSEPGDLGGRPSAGYEVHPEVHLQKEPTQ